MIARARAGDRAAFSDLVRRYQQPAFRAAYLIVRDAHGAEDVAQEAFVRAYEHLRSFRAGELFRPWLLRIVTNLARNEVRARGRRSGMLARFSRRPESYEPAADRVVVLTEQNELLARAVSELGMDYRVVLYLRFFLELPEREIAIAIGRPPGTVKSRLSRATGRLRAVLEARYPDLRPGEEAPRG